MVTTALGYTPGTSNLTIGTTASTAAAGNHNHSGVYQPSNANLTALSNLGLSTSTSGFVRLAKDSGGNMSASIDSNTYSLSSHTHTASISQSGSSGTTLAHNTWYTLTAGGSTVTFKTPADNNTNYYPIRSYTSGLQISSYSGSTDCQLYVPYATSSQAGAVSTGDQTFNGNKTFANGDVYITEGALKINSDDYGTWSDEDWDTWFKADRISVLNADTEESWDVLFPQLSDGSEARMATLETDQTFTGINTFQGGGGGGGQYGSDLGYIQFRGVSALSTAYTNLRALGSSGITYNVLLPARNGTLATVDQIPDAAPNW